MRVARTAGTAHNAGAKLSGNGPAVTPGEQYTASAWVKGLDANIGNGQCSVYMEWLDGGGSFISDPNGNLLAKAGHEQEEIVLAECDLGLLDAVRTHWPFLRDRRIDAYGDLTRRYLD